MERLFFFLLLFIVCANSSAQTSRSFEIYPDSLNKKRLATVITVETGAYVAGLSFLGLIWYADRERVDFHFYDDSKGYLQMDKAGHAFAAYHESRIAYRSLRWAGVKDKKAILYGGPAGLLFQTPIEIFDGLYPGWGFSWSDMAANTFGSLLFTTQQLFLGEQTVSMKFSYAPSIYPSYHHALGESPIESFFLDYNAHTYWLSGNLNGLSGSTIFPDWLNIAVGYSANGMIKEFDNPTVYRGEPFPDLKRYRQYLFSLDIDFTKIPARKKWVRVLLRTVNTIKVPFPALEFNRIDGIKFRGLYF